MFRSAPYWDLAQAVTASVIASNAPNQHVFYPYYITKL
jgi:hypothetical protein